MQELVEAIRNGDRAQLAELYKQNTGLLYTLARRYRGRDPMVGDEDLMQAGFLGLVAAVDAWDPERGAWSTIATGYIMNAMRGAVGIRGTRQRAHLGAVSLDAPIGEDGDTARADLLADESLPDSDERIIGDERRAAVRAAVGRLEARKRDVVELHDLQGQALAQVGEGMSVSLQRAQQIRKDAFKDLRRDRQLRRALDEETLYYRYWGVGAFNTTFTSVTERVALWRIEMRERYGTPKQPNMTAREEGPRWPRG
jgi:RNA polymerase sigma factor (sigma-70 family)